MVRKRLVTVLTMNDGVLFRTRNFQPDYRYTANFVDAWSVDEVVLLDITRPGEGQRENFFEAVRALARNCFVPLAVGGGVRTPEDFAWCLGMGGDKVVVNTQAALDPGFVTAMSHRYGSQCVVASLDARLDPDGVYRVYTHCGSQPLGRCVEEQARSMEGAGAGEILIQSVDRDGSLEGYDLDLVTRVADAVRIPVLACSGAGNWQHFVDGFAAGASAVCTSNIYHFTEPSIKSAKNFLRSAGVAVRT